MDLENEYKFGCCKPDNYRFFLRTPSNLFQILYQTFMGMAFGALMADYFRQEWINTVMFEFWAYVPVVCILMAPISYSLICDGPIETDLYSNTRGYSFYFTRYWYFILFTAWDCVIRETDVVDDQVKWSQIIRIM